MKKSLLLLASIIGLSSLNAQTFEQTTKFRDNWSVGISGGIVSPLTHSAFFKNARATMGVNLNKQFSPIYGLTAENMWSINAFDSQAAFDATNLSLLHRINLNNVFCKYDGKPDLFEVEAVAGFGWLHINDFYPRSWEGEPILTDANWITSKAGLNLNFNLGEKKAWTVAVKPAVSWCVTQLDRNNIQFDANQACWEITAGVVYHFKNSNGTHYLVNGCSHASEIAALNATIGTMEAEAASKDRALQSAQNTISDLEKALKECKNKKPVVQKPVEDLDIVISFRQSSSKIDALQMVNIDRLAKFMKKNKDAKVVVKGYASPEGDKTFNEKLSQKRADAIKNKLVKDYKIAEDRIIATGEGVGSVFETPKYNRASICVAK